jgi:hypothetical protein
MTAPFTKASEIAEFLSARLAEITVANGYHTDIGVRTYRGRRNIADELVPCSVLIEGEDHPGQQGGRDSQLITQDYVCGGYDICDPENPNDKAHLIIKDIKKAIFGTPSADGRDRSFGGIYTLGGQVKACRYVGRDIGPRTDGNAIVFAVVHIEIDFAETLLDA